MPSLKAVLIGPALQVSEQLCVHQIDSTVPLIDPVLWNADKDIVRVQVIPTKILRPFSLAAKRMADVWVRSKRLDLIAQSPVNARQRFLIKVCTGKLSKQHRNTDIITLGELLTKR